MKLAFLFCVMLLQQVAATFPPGFIWGSATAAYQIEGAWKEGNKEMSNWDFFSHIPGKIYHNENGDVADDSYHRVSEDIALMEDVGFTGSRFSIAWTRVMFNNGTINPAGIAHYNDVINQLLAKNIIPLVTLYHWDMPYKLSTLSGGNGFLNKTTFIPAFRLFAEACFLAFGDRVHHWITFNEPLTICKQGYGDGSSAPGRKLHPGKEPYECAHTLILAHAYTVATFRAIFPSQPAPAQAQKIGITLNVDWALPFDASSIADQQAAQRLVVFELGWFADPLAFGHYPAVMREMVGQRLPVFTSDERQLLLSSGLGDFLGLNHYTSVYVQATKKGGVPLPPSWSSDQQSTQSPTNATGHLIGPVAASPWLHVYPPGIRHVLQFASERYHSPAIYITENGCDVPGENQLPRGQALNDTFRVKYFRDYLTEVELALDEGVDVQGYFAWSLLDNFEWLDGYNFRFGLTYVDYDDNEKRYPKESSRFFQSFIASEAKKTATAQVKKQTKKKKTNTVMRK